ncbi:MAG: hypothetical protein HYU63_07790, partial [Armatimonadetes bacterium]|nr:hypothetical protein [Armatimonadota bacterium]
GVGQGHWNKSTGPYKGPKGPSSPEDFRALEKLKKMQDLSLQSEIYNDGKVIVILSPEARRILELEK